MGKIKRKIGEIKKSLKECQIYIKKKKLLREMFQDLKVRIEATKKTQKGGILEMENLDKQTGTTNAYIINII